MNQYEFIHKELFPLLTFQAKQDIHNYISSDLQKELCISALINRKNKLQMEIDSIEKAINLLKTIKN